MSPILAYGMSRFIMTTRSGSIGLETRPTCAGRCGCAGPQTLTGFCLKATLRFSQFLPCGWEEGCGTGCGPEFVLSCKWAPYCCSILITTQLSCQSSGDSCSPSWIPGASLPLTSWTLPSTPYKVLEADAGWPLRRSRGQQTFAHSHLESIIFVRVTA